MTKERDAKNVCEAFYEEWRQLENNSAVVNADFADDVEIRQLQLTNLEKVVKQDLYHHQDKMPNKFLNGRFKVGYLA